MSLETTDLSCLRSRQQRLAGVLAERGVELAILTRRESVCWLTGAWTPPLFHPCAAITGEGSVTLVRPSRQVGSPAVCDTDLGYEEKWLSTMRDACNQQQASVEQLLDAVGTLPDRVGCEATAAGSLFFGLPNRAPTSWVDLDGELFRLRRKKDASELKQMAAANEANRRMYELARERVAPGVHEITLYTELQAAAVAELGEPLTYFGQDFRCAARGGPPRDRKAEAGELYIFDLGVGLRGYHTDNARTLAVTEPTDAQQRAWAMIAAVFPMIEETVKPGVSCRAVFDRAKAMLADADPWVFNHHLGHGVGLAPHEGPHLNPNWDDQFETGDYFTVEPGLYHEELRAGIRLEQNYVVTDTGVQLLTDWPLGL